jgi:hypothetical protein
MNIVKESRFMELYIKAEELKRFWNMNKVVDKRTITQKRSAEVNKFDQRTSLIGTMLVQRDFENVIINAGQLWQEAKEQKSYGFETGKVQALRYYIEARIRCEDKLKFKEGLEEWMPVLYNIGGLNFENCWLELFFLVATDQIPPQTLISETYEYLLTDFSLHDQEKLEQMERLNEVRSVYGMKTENWWNDEIARWMNVHRMKLKRGQQIPQRQIPGLIDLHLEQEQPSPMESEYEDMDTTPWKEKVAEISKVKMNQIASGTEVDIIRSNIQELMNRLKETDSNYKKGFDDLKISSENAYKMNEHVLEKIQEMNEINTKIREDVERRRPAPPLKEIDVAVEEVEEDTEDELRNNSDTETQTEGEPENDLPEDVLRLNVLMADILNEEIKNIIPRIQRSHFKKLKCGLKLVFNGITNLFKRLNENRITGKNDEERSIIEMAFRCLTHRIRKHIAEKIGKDTGKEKEKGLARRINKRNPGLYSDEDLEKEREIRIKVENQQTSLASAIGKLKELKKLLTQKRMTDS